MSDIDLEAPRAPVHTEAPLRERAAAWKFPAGVNLGAFGALFR
jgi:hypothetical protein